MLETLLASKAGQQFAGNLGASLGQAALGGGPVSSGTGATDGRGFMDGSGWSVATGGSKATGGTSGGGAQAQQPGFGAASQAGMNPWLIAALMGAALWAYLKNKD